MAGDDFGSGRDCLRIVLWALGALTIILVLGGVALQIAITRNGPAVLSAIDWLTGSTSSASKLATISTGDSDQQKLIVWGSQTRNRDAAALPVLIFTHGGSWQAGDPADYGFIGRAFVPKGFVVVLVGYRLGHLGVYPAMLEDTARAVQWTHENIAQYGGDPDRIVLAGHSAGAYNSVMVALDQRWLSESRSGGKSMDPKAIAGVVGLSGPYDFHPFDSESTINAFGGAANPEATQALPYVRADVPPMLLIHGEKDSLVGLHNSRDLVRQINEAGGIATLMTYPEMAHNDPLMSLAAPWRGNRDIDDAIAQFAQTVTANQLG